MENIYSDKYFEATVLDRFDDFDRETGEEIRHGNPNELEKIRANSLEELKNKVWKKYIREEFTLTELDEDSFYESVCESNWLLRGEDREKIQQYEFVQIRFYEKTLTQLIIKE